MNIFFDTEFTELVPGTTLISIGMVTENGKQFCAEFTDYNEDLVTPWIKENVLYNRLLTPCENRITEDCWMFSGGTWFIWNRLLFWLEQVSGAQYEIFGDSFKDIKLLNPEEAKQIQLISDVCHYDMYLFCNQIFGGAFNLPENVNPVCYDICQDLCIRETKYSPKASDWNYRKPLWYPGLDDMKNAFNLSREDACEGLNGKLPEGKKHNALYDAKVIKMIYEGMRK